MADPTAIRIPSDLLPADGRFGCGPSKVRPEALQALAATGSELLGTSHRKARVKDQVARLRTGVADLFDLPGGYEVLLVAGGATAFWEMAAFGIIDQRARHYAFGEFSSKFAKVTAAAPFLDDPDVVETPVGARPEVSAAPGCDVQALTHNETSTGVMMDITRPEGDDPGTLVLVDATSGAGGLPVDPHQFDTYYFSLQKGFASEGGLGIVLASPAAIERDARRAATCRRSWRGAPDQTYNTPAIATIFLAAETVDWMNASGGLDAMVAGCRAKADVMYGWAEDRDWASPFVSDPDARSLVVATVDLDDAVSADDVNAALRGNGILRRLPQAGPQPASDRDVPGRRPRRHRGLHGLRRPRGRGTPVGARRGARCPPARSVS